MSKPPQELIEAFKRRGAVRSSLPDADGWTEFLDRQVASLYRAGAPVRPWHLWELHNPWSRAATRVDSWRFLDLCQSAELLALVRALLGPDLILFDSQLLPAGTGTGKPGTGLCDESIHYPVRPLAGLSVRIAFREPPGEARRFMLEAGNDGDRGEADGERPATLPVRRGSIICHRADVRYMHGSAAQPFEYVIRYFPATSAYVRDAGDPVQQVLMEHYPLVNYARMPLWLVSGKDHASNDFATGFNVKTGRWTDTSW